jgi:hypothetical protein
MTCRGPAAFGRTGAGGRETRPAGGDRGQPTAPGGMKSGERRNAVAPGPGAAHTYRVTARRAAAPRRRAGCAQHGRGQRPSRQLRGPRRAPPGRLRCDYNSVTVRRKPVRANEKGAPQAKKRVGRRYPREKKRNDGVTKCGSHDPRGPARPPTGGTSEQRLVPFADNADSTPGRRAQGRAIGANGVSLNPDVLVIYSSARGSARE